jgi:hypothetical protein
VNKKGKVTHVADLVLQFRRKTHTQTFYIADLGNDHMILGKPFLAAKNPNINWTTGSFISKVEAATIDAHHKPLLPFAIEPKIMKANLSDQSHFKKFIAKYTNDSLPYVINVPTMQQPLEGSVRVARKEANFDQFLEPAVRLDTFQSQSDQRHLLDVIFNYTNEGPKEDQVLIRCTTKATTLAADAVDKTSCTWQEQVPHKYYKYGQVFSEEELQ